MDSLGNINNRQVYYSWVPKPGSWGSELPEDGWLALLIGDEKDINLLDKVADICLDKKAAYICCLGKECEWIHDLFDEGVWFALTCAYHAEKETGKVICLDLTDYGCKDRLIRLLEKINEGWLP